MKGAMKAALAIRVSRWSLVVGRSVRWMRRDERGLESAFNQSPFDPQLDQITDPKGTTKRTTKVVRRRTNDERPATNDQIHESRPRQ
jgi:hypothetical protein